MRRSGAIFCSDYQSQFSVLDDMALIRPLVCSQWSSKSGSSQTKAQRTTHGEIMNQPQLVPALSAATLANLRDAAVKQSQGRLRDAIDSLVRVRCSGCMHCIALHRDQSVHTRTGAAVNARYPRPDHSTDSGAPTWHREDYIANAELVIDIGLKKVGP